MSDSLYVNTDTPAAEQNEVPGPTIGTVIVLGVAGTITHLKWYCPATLPTNASAVPFTLYDATTQAQLARVVSPVTAGWNTVALTTPYHGTAGQAVVPSVYTASRYSYTGGYFSSAGRTVGNLTAPATGAPESLGGNGRFSTATDGFPSSTFGGNNYWTDVVFVPDSSTTPVTSSLTIKWRVWQSVTSSLTSPWRVFQKVLSTISFKWFVASPPTPAPTPSTAVLAAQRAATLAFIADDPTTASLIPVTRVKTAGGGFTEQAGTPRTPQTFKMSELNFGTPPLVTVAGVERVVDYHLIGPWDMQINVGDYWVDEGGSRFDVVGFSEGWGYMRKALISRHVPRDARL